MPPAIEFDKDNKELFALAGQTDVLMRDMMNDFNQRRIKLFDLAAHQRIFLFILTRSFKTYTAIRHLCEEGLAQDSATLVRSLLENLITVRFILQDPAYADEKARRFVAFKWIILRRQLIEQERGLPEMSEEERVRFLNYKENILHRVEEFKKTYQIVSDKALVTWSGKTVRDMAHAVDVALLEEYERVFRVCSRFAHPSILGDKEYMIQEGAQLVFSPLPSGIGVNVNLGNAVNYAREFIRLINSLFHLHFENRIDALKQSVDKYFQSCRNSASIIPPSSKPEEAGSIRESIVVFKTSL